MAEKVIDVAMESTSQEILEKVEQGVESALYEQNNTMNFVYHTATLSTVGSKTTPFFSINGKGKLYYAQLMVIENSSAYNQIRVVLDGNEIYKHEGKTTGGTATRISYVGSLSALNGVKISQYKSLSRDGFLFNESMEIYLYQPTASGTQEEIFYALFD